MPHNVQVTVVSHPFASNGMGEQGRASLRALQAVGLQPKSFDLFRYAARKDPDHRSLVLPVETQTLPKGIRIFHINGDEVDSALEALADRGVDFDAGYNVIVPAWELPIYPSTWRSKLKKFDEVWAISKFVQSSLLNAEIDSYYVGQSVDADRKAFLPRKYFGIRESAFVLLNFFDTASFFHRKNPSAVIRLYKKFRAARPYDDLQLVLKVRSGDSDASELEDLISEEIPRDVLFIAKHFQTFEMRSLISAADCLLSLHRSEGFGRGLAEAMDLNRLAMGTGWSGNCDFMSIDNSLLVDSSLTDVEEGQYPHWENQRWAEPDEDHAFHLLLGVVDDPYRARRIKRRGKMDLMMTASNRAVGLRVYDRLRHIATSL
jgi:hypothetical protein